MRLLNLIPRDFLDRVEDGTIQITDEEFPSFLYETDTVYDKENEDIGLVRGLSGSLCSLNLRLVASALSRASVVLPVHF